MIRHLGDCVRYADENGKRWVLVRSDILREAFNILNCQEPQLLSHDELAALPIASVVWEEFYNADRGAGTSLTPMMKCNTTTFVNEYGYTLIADMRGPDVDGNRKWRWWSYKPTDELRSETKWL